MYKHKANLTLCSLVYSVPMWTLDPEMSTNKYRHAFTHWKLMHGAIILLKNRARELFGVLWDERNQPTCGENLKILRIVSWWRRKLLYRGWKTHNNEPKYVLPVRTAKHKALNNNLCLWRAGSKIRCSTTPASIWYLLGKGKMKSKSDYCHLRMLQVVSA